MRSVFFTLGVFVGFFCGVGLMYSSSIAIIMKYNRDIDSLSSAVFSTDGRLLACEKSLIKKSPVQKIRKKIR